MVAPTPFRLTILGGFQLRSASGRTLTMPTRKMEAMMAYLALRLAQTHPRDKLAGLLWSDRANTQARKSVRQTVYRLRKVLGRAGQSALASRHVATRR
jgi:DNA-binding SARP family transcriptional activator